LVRCVVVWLRVAGMSADGGATRRVHGILPGSSLPIPFVLRESYLPSTGTAPFDPG
jgi:hypothetical protein